MEPTGSINKITDKEVEDLLDDQRLGETEREADNRRSKLSKEEFHTLRALAKRDLFYLCYSILGNDRFSTNLHGDLCWHFRLADKLGYQFSQWLLPRGHFKSTAITIAGSIQAALPYTAEDRAHDTYIDEWGELGWPYTLGTDIRILIGHETAESAYRFLYAITSHFTGNPLLQTLFPDAVPSKRKNRINKSELELPRSAKARGFPEPTIDTLGVGAKSQGRHYNIIDLDDIFGDKARDSPAEAEATIQWFDNIQSFFSTFAKDKLRLVGTRYSTDDVYAHAEETYGKLLYTYTRAVEEVDKKDGQKKSIFPEEFTSDKLEIIKKNKKVFHAQYLNDPFDGDTKINFGNIRKFVWQSQTSISPLEYDEKGNLKPINSIISIRDLNIAFLIDPGIGTSGGFCITGTDYLANHYSLVALPLEGVNPSDFTDLVFKNAMMWQPRTVAIESDLFANTFQYWWAAEMPRRGVNFHITPVYTKKAAKEMRISGLIPYIDSGTFFISESQKELVRELKTYGKSKNIHILDALAYGPEIWQLGYAPGAREQFESMSESSEQSLDDRDILTGYSPVTQGKPSWTAY
jgi:hypothetical protein